MDFILKEKKYVKRKEKAVLEGNRNDLALVCNRLGDMYNERGQYQNALKEYEEEACIYGKLGKQLEMARARRMVGEMQMMLGLFDEAKIHIMKYLDIASILNNTVEEQRAFTTLGRLHLLHGQSLNETSLIKPSVQLREAEKAFLRSLLLTKKLSGKVSKIELLDMQARCYLNIGIVKEHLEDFDESIRYIEKAINVSKANDIYELTHQCYISLSLIYHCKKNDACMGLRFCNQALEVAKLLPQKVTKICETLIIKAEILIKEGDFSSAKQVLAKAYKKNAPNENDRRNIINSLKIVVKLCHLLDDLITTSSTDFVKTRELYEQLGDGCCRLGNYKKALEYYLKMYECAIQSQESGKALVPIYVSLYQTYKDVKQYDQALEFLWKEYGLHENEPAEACSTLLAVAEVYELQNQTFWSIQDIYRQALQQADKAGNAKLKLEKVVYIRLKKLQQKHGMDILAEELAKEAIEKGINIESNTDASDSENESNLNESEYKSQTSDDDIQLSTLSDSDGSYSEETDQLHTVRSKRGTRSLVIKRNNKGETQLHQACISGNIELVRLLIDQGHPLNVRDHAGWLPLHEACNHGFREIVEYLLDHGALSSINDKGGTSCDGITPLYDASSNGYLDVVELLLDRGADVTLKTDFGDTCVDALDKWKQASEITDGEHAHYLSLRSRMLKSLSVVGSVKPYSETKNVPLYDDDNDEEEEGNINFEDDTSPTITTNEKSFNQNIAPSIHKNWRRSLPNEIITTQIKGSHVLSDDDEDIENMRPNKKRCYQTKLKSHLLTLKRKSSYVYPDDSLVHNNHSERYSDASVNPKTITKNITMNSSKQCAVESHKIDLNVDDTIVTAEPDSTTTCKKQSPIKVTPLVPPTVSFKVKVEDELFLVPIDQTKLNTTSMSWLADEAAKRYYNLIGLRPALRLKTSDGFAYAETDCVNVALSHNIIIASVIEWRTTPLAQRYEEICSELHLHNHAQIKNELLKSELSNTVQLNDFWLNTIQCQVIFKCIMHQKNIRVLNLSNNFIQNEGCFQLAKCLMTLPHLTTLNLKGNFIKADGFKELLLSLCNASGANQLNIEELVLNQNPLGDESMPLLDKFCSSPSGKSLKKLHLSNCNISQLDDCFICLSQLIDLDISFNNLTNDAIFKLMKHLNAQLLQSINISFCQNENNIPSHFKYNDGNSIGDIITKFFENNICHKLQNVQLANCQLNDIHLYKIIQNLINCENLILIDISDNDRLYSTTLYFILNNLPQLRKLIVLNCKDFFAATNDTKSLQNATTMPTFIMTTKYFNSSALLDFKHIWFQYWADKAKMEIIQNSVIFYINDNDLNLHL